ncbi:uncharacterized protein LOC105457711 [Trichonephila clavipes]|nr:uncharacterized protein LOC105457711 [Trichonephila clavipes]
MPGPLGYRNPLSRFEVTMLVWCESLVRGASTGFGFIVWTAPQPQMPCKNIKLGDIPIIANSLKCGTTRAVKTLNSISGFTEFDRSSRNKIRNFSTFPNEFRVEEHKEKILTEFSLPDFISVANLLHLDVETNEQNLCNSIFKDLTNLDEFQLTLNNSKASFSEGENVVSKTNHVRQEFFIGRDRPALPFSTSGQ